MHLVYTMYACTCTTNSSIIHHAQVLAMFCHDSVNTHIGEDAHCFMLDLVTFHLPIKPLVPL